MTMMLSVFFDGLCEPVKPGGVACYGFAVYSMSTIGESKVQLGGATEHPHLGAVDINDLGQFNHSPLDLVRALFASPSSRRVSASIIWETSKDSGRWLVPGLISPKQFLQSPMVWFLHQPIVTLVHRINLFAESFLRSLAPKLQPSRAHVQTFIGRSFADFDSRHSSGEPSHSVQRVLTSSRTIGLQQSDF